MRSTASSSPTHTEPMARAREGLAVDRVGDSALEAAQCFEGCHAGGDLASVVDAAGRHGSLIWQPTWERIE
jgi:hypothetical protein